ncbi:Integral membrane protein [Methanosarcina sp. MTP4]|uniref:acyltransferase n=1 Tax=Methanosarcina sp. MTP4 TaxID=1434100 RepID=UPI0006160164|nr:acyltransferase [Methanosarcina sp. MTP4]AKB25602.1 Integral membrane protein [Methanosarcina sp. MTP4]
MKNNANNSFQNTRIREIDFLRGFAILAVIAIHSSTNFSKIFYLNSLVIFNLFIDVFSQYGVPLFIFISGFVLSNKYYGLFSVKEFYKKRVISIIPQYLLFSILYISFFAILSNNLPSFSEIILKILTANSAIHMWFFLTITGFYIFYPVIICIYSHFDERNNLFTFLMLSLIIQVTWSISALIIETGGYEPLFIYLAKRIFIPYLFYFVLGIYVSKNFHFVYAYMESIKKYKVILLLILALITIIISFFWIVGFGYYVKGFDSFYSMSTLYFIIPVIIEVLYYPLIFFLLFEASSKIMKRENLLTSIMYSLGRHSFGIYLVHFFFITLIIIQLEHFNIYSDNWVFYPILFVGTTLLSLLSVSLISNLPFGELVIGGTGNKKSI